jgi:hypothetical protein
MRSIAESYIRQVVSRGIGEIDITGPQQRCFPRDREARPEPPDHSRLRRSDSPATGDGWTFGRLRRYPPQGNRIQLPRIGPFGRELIVARQGAANDSVFYHSLSALAKRGGKFLVHVPEETTRRSSGRVWRKVPDNILSDLSVGLHLIARRLPPPLLRPCFVVLSCDFVEGTFIPFPESTA